MSHFIVGTCGHIDHGKTALIRALNGFEGDTLKEEKERGITIDLSFSNLSNGEKNIAFIDVPGHEKLVKNMISGAFGFDSVLIVVSAAEGVKPQTVEHLEILKLLGVTEGILVVSKKDLVAEELLSRRIKEIRQQVESYGFDLHDVMAVSVHDEYSIGKLKERLFQLEPAPKAGENFFRMYADRVFSLKGAGTVVTGTVLGDALSRDERVVVCDTGRTCRIKNIQVHGENVEKAEISNRVAINLGGVDAREIERGFLIGKKGYLRGFREIDIAFEALGEERLSHDREYAVHIGSRHLQARLTLFDIEKGRQRGFATLKSSKDIFAVHGEKMIIREGNRTLAGATVLNPIADPLRKKQKRMLLEALEKRDFGSAYAVLLEAHRHGLGLVSSAQRFALSHEEALEKAKALEHVFVDEKELVVYPSDTQQEIVQTIRDIYEKNPCALLSAASLKLRMPWAGTAFIESALQILLEEQFLAAERKLYRSTRTKEDLDTVLEDRIAERLEEEDLSPSAPNNIYDELDLDRRYGDVILKRLCTQKRVVRLQHNLFLHSGSLAKIAAEMRKIIEEEGYIDIRNFKAKYALSRKYLIAYLEYLDCFSDIVKEGDRRRSV